jgi:hypothetical protein
MYKFRNTPVNWAQADAEGKRWCVTGVHNAPSGQAAGVLEWCHDERDAQQMLAKMQRFPEFTDLKVDKF